MSKARRLDADARSGAPAYHPAVERMVTMLRVDPSLSVKELSALLGLSLSRLARVFKRQIGISIVGYRNELKFERFLALLTQEGGRPHSLRLTARLAGFGSYAHFHRLFRARWHSGPRAGVKKGVLTLAATVRSGTGARVLLVREES